MDPSMPLRAAPSRPRPRAWLLAVAGLVLVSSSCTFSASRHLEVDFLGAQYRFYLYEKPTSQISVELRLGCQREAGAARRRWARCSLQVLRDHVQVPSVGAGEWAAFTKADKWDDYGAAVDEVVTGGFSFDARRERYARRCLVGDHVGFRSHNWTTRPASDGHCKRGENVA